MLMGKCPDPHLPIRGGGRQHLSLALYLDPLEQRLQALHEIAPVSQGLQTDQIALQQALQQCRSPRELQEDVERRKGAVQEKPDSRLHAELSQIGGHVHEMVIVDPDEIFRGRGLTDRLGKPPVDLAIALPVLRVEIAERLQIVEQGPEDLIGESSVEPLDLRRTQHHGPQRIPEMLARLGHRMYEVAVAVGGPRPAYPGPAAFL